MDGESAQPETSRDPAGEITRILGEGLAGADATTALLPFVYDELRSLAAYRLAQERPGHGATGRSVTKSDLGTR